MLFSEFHQIIHFEWLIANYAARKAIGTVKAVN